MASVVDVESLDVATYEQVDRVLRRWLTQPTPFVSDGEFWLALAEAHEARGRFYEVAMEQWSGPANYLFRALCVAHIACENDARRARANAREAEARRVRADARDADALAAVA
jgi:hypothetical protein